MNELEVKLNRMQAQIDGQEETIRDRDQKIANIEAQNKMLRAIIAEKDMTNNNLRAMIGELEDEVEAWKETRRLMIENINQLIEKYRQA